MTKLGIPFILFALATTTTGSAQTPSSDSSHATRVWCFRGQPLPACQRFVVFEPGVYVPVARNSKDFTAFGRTDHNDAFTVHYALDLGAMKNTDDQTAIGVVGTVGFSSFGPRFAVKPRYRRWLDAKENTSFEVAAGPLWTEIGSVRSSGGMGITADARYNYQDRVGVTARVDRLHTTEYGTGQAAYVGLSLGGKPGAVATGIIATATAVLIVWFITTFKGHY